jgi:hypothetical protein
MGLAPIPPLQPERDRSPHYETDVASNAEFQSTP